MLMHSIAIQIFTYVLLYGMTCQCMILYKHGLPPGEQRLYKMTIDKDNANIYIGATNAVYVRDGNLSSVAKIQIGPYNDSLQCPPNPQKKCECLDFSTDNGNDSCTIIRQPTNAMVKNLVIYKNELIVCSNIYYGHCSKISLLNFSLKDDIYVPIVSNSVEGESIAFIASSGNLDEAFYVASSRDTKNGRSSYKDLSPMLSVRNLKNFEIAFFDSATDSLSAIDVNKAIRDDFPIFFKYGYFFNGYSYFISTHRISQQSNDTATFIVRICQKDKTMTSYAELKLDCSIEDRKYNGMMSAYVSKIGTNLSKSLGLTSNEECLFGVFSPTKSFAISEGSSAICVFPLKRIENEFESAINRCFSGLGKTGPEYITKPRPCVEEQPSKMCGGSENNSPIYNPRISIAADAFYRLFEHSLTSIVVKRTLDKYYTIAYLGTQNGHLLKVIFENETVMKVFGEEKVEERPINKDMMFDAKEEHLYVMTDQQVMKVSVYNCSAYLTCDTCIGAQDPHCGWCNYENKCSESHLCAHGTIYAWLSYNTSACPAFTGKWPKMLSVDQLTQEKIILQFTHDFPRGSELSCSFYDGKTLITTKAQSFISSVQCSPMNGDFKFPTVESVSFSNIDIWINVNGTKWISGEIVVYDCSKLSSCFECVDVKLPCIWCNKTSMCVNSRSSCSTSSAIWSNTNTNSTKRGDSEDKNICPYVELIDNQNLIVAGRSRQLKLYTHKFTNFMKTDLKCVFENENVIEVKAVFDEREDTVTCENVTLNYKSQSGSKDVAVKVFWGNNHFVDSKKDTKLTVYKCLYMANTCGKCTLLDPYYQCGWCATKCVLQDNCVQQPWLTKSDLCPNPKIISISPQIGPYLGGTNLTITGENLGKSFEDIQNSVTVAGVKCPVLHNLYVPSNVIVCKTGNSVEVKKGVVKVVITSQSVSYEAVSSQEYQYQDPILGEFEPKDPKGPVSGGTIVKITGRYLNMGSQVTVTIEDRICPVISRGNSYLEFTTASQPAPINGFVTVTFDDVDSDTIPASFKYISNPRISSINPKVAISSGGSVLTINGTDLHSSSKPKFVLFYKDSSMEANCEDISKSRLLCKLPEFKNTVMESTMKRSAQSQHGAVIAQLDYKIQIDGWSADRTDLSYTLDADFPLFTIYKDPVLKFLNVITYTTGASFDIMGENLEIFKLIPGLKVTVGNTSCDIKDITQEKIVIFSPEKPNVMLNGKSDIVVHHGNMRVTVGTVQYPTAASSNIGVIVGIFFGVIIPVILIVVVVIVIRRLKNKKPDSVRTRDNGTIERANIYNPPSENEVKSSEGIPLKDVHPQENYSQEEVEEDEEISNKPFQLSDFLKRIRDPKLRNNVQEVLVPLERLEMKEMIGRGNFGCVYIADLHADEDSNACRVAVKTLQGERLEQHTVEAFLKEGVIMKNFNHPHVLKLLGVCIDEQENPMVILPYMANGDLRTYVKDKEKNFTARQLLQLAQQVAEGMAYLSSLNFVHRDLAARNCMIDEFNTVKVADFGLTRDLFEKQYFSTNLKEKRGKMPIKWMALESLEEFVFTTKSDVWSFGVLMWELMTRAVTPYPDVDIFDVRNYLASGHRLRKPKYCPENIYTIMLECWHADADMRPTFIDLVNKIELMLNPPKKRQKEETSGEPMYVNIRKANSTEYLKPVDGSISDTPENVA